MEIASLTQAEIEDAAKTIAPFVIRTPFISSAVNLSSYGIDLQSLGLKLELFQKTGTFKARGACNAILSTPREQLINGIVTASGGNHGVAVAWAAQQHGYSAKIVMPYFANKRRQDLCRSYGAEVIQVSDLCEVFKLAEEIRQNEKRFMLHPFEGKNISLGTATIGREIAQDSTDLDFLLVPIGGGGLISGLATAMRLYSPSTEVIGVEPFGADAMFRSMQSGGLTTLEKVNTIADSLGSPLTLPFSFSLCKQFVSEVVRVTDTELKQAMILAFEEFKLALEPASAASIAALLGPLRKKVKGKNVGLVICGANIDYASFIELQRDVR
jgi:threonine dehydratase